MKCGICVRGSVGVGMDAQVGGGLPCMWVLNAGHRHVNSVVRN